MAVLASKQWQKSGWPINLNDEPESVCHGPVAQDSHCLIEESDGFLVWSPGIEKKWSNSIFQTTKIVEQLLFLVCFRLIQQF